MRTIVYGIQKGTLKGKLPLQVRMQPMYIGMAVEPKPNATLVGNYDNESASGTRLPHRFGYTGEQFKIIQLPSVRATFAVHYAIAV